MKLDHVLEALRNGAMLYLTLADKPTWKLSDGVTEVTVNSRAVQSMLKRGALVGNGDTLFDDVPSQTWRFRPHLNWKQGEGKWGKNTHSTLGGAPSYGRYVITWSGFDEPSGYRVDFATSTGRGSLSKLNACCIPKLEDAKALAELHRDKRRELIRKYGDKRNVPHEAWMKFRAELQAWQQVRFGFAIETNSASDQSAV
jgi:hypothetical protein